MKRFFSVVMLLLIFPGLHARSVKKVRVRIFSKYRLQRVVLELRGGGWLLNGRPVSSGRYRITMLGDGRITLSGKGFRRSGFRFRFRGRSPLPLFGIRARGISRQYWGDLTCCGSGRGMVLINRVGLEHYTASVLFGEVPSLAGRRNIVPALKAQAVAIRSYARYFLQPGKERHKKGGYDFCDLTHCQVYRGVVPPGFRSILRAVRETRGLVLRFRGRLVPGFYSSTCGGRTVSPGEVWGDRALDDAFPGAKHRLHGRIPCRLSEHSRWVYSLPAREFLNFFSTACFPLLSVRDLQPVFGKGGSLRFVKTGYNRIPGHVFRNRFCKRYGWNSLRSLRFTFRLQGGRILFKGRGLGHRVGLCQHGAFAYAAAGWGWRKILKEYYPALRVGR